MNYNICAPLKRSAVDGGCEGIVNDERNTVSMRCLCEPFYIKNNKRGIYGGAIGYIDFTGNMDMCIAIRLVYKKNGRVFVRSGAGIVADSVPEKEFEESLNKARASLNALMLAGEVDE